MLLFDDSIIWDDLIIFSDSGDYEEASEFILYPTTGEITYLGYNPTLDLRVNLSVPKGSISWNGNNSSVSATVSLIQNVSNIEFTSYSPDLSIEDLLLRMLSVPSGSITFETYDPLIYISTNKGDVYKFMARDKGLYTFNSRNRNLYIFNSRDKNLYKFTPQNTKGE